MITNFSLLRRYNVPKLPLILYLGLSAKWKNRQKRPEKKCCLFSLKMSKRWTATSRELSQSCWKLKVIRTLFGKGSGLKVGKNAPCPKWQSLCIISWIYLQYFKDPANSKKLKGWSKKKNKNKSKNKKKDFAGVSRSQIFLNSWMMFFSTYFKT